jgi:lipopolysaccharide heptosyltransferase I
VTPTALSLAAPPRNILIIKPSAIGDLVHALPVLPLLARRWPEARISWLVNSDFADLLEGHPLLAEVIRFERRRFGQGWRNPLSLLGLWRFTRGLRRRRFDLVIDLQGLLRSGWLAWRSGAPARIGFAEARELAPMFYTHRVAADARAEHAVDRYLKVAAALGCNTEPVEFPFAITAEDRAAIGRLLDGSLPAGRRIAVLLPGANWPTKRWPAERFAAIAELLRRRMDLEPVIAGGAKDAALAAKIPGLNLVGRTSLRQLVALLERADLVVANDSGPMHIAAALGRPLVAAYGPTNPASTGPYGRDDSVVRVDIACSPCYSRACTHQSCLQWLSVEPVFDLAQQQLARHR